MSNLNDNNNNNNNNFVGAEINENNNNDNIYEEVANAMKEEEQEQQQKFFYQQLPQTTLESTPSSTMLPDHNHHKVSSASPTPLQQQQYQQPSLTTDNAQFVRTPSDNMAPGHSSSSTNPAIARQQMKEAARSRILGQVQAKYPGKPKEFWERKVNKQIAVMYPEMAQPVSGSMELGTNTPTTSTTNPLPQNSFEEKPLAESSDTGAMDIDNGENNSNFRQSQIPNSTNQSTPRESSQLPDVAHPSGSGAQPTYTNGADFSGNASDSAAEGNMNCRQRARSPLMVTKMKAKGILVGYYRLSDVNHVEDKHAVYGKIDKGGDLFTTVSKETRSGNPVPSQQYLASKVQCHPSKIVFEPHLDGLNKQQLKQYVQNRLNADWSFEDEHSRMISERHFADLARNDPALVGLVAGETKRQSTASTGTKRAYAAFADENEDDDEEDEDMESPLSDVNEPTFRETDDEDAFVPSGSNKKRKSGRKSIGARTAKGDSKETDGDEIREGVLVGVWRGSTAQANSDKHAVYSYLDSRDSLWSRIFHNTKDGRHIDMDIPFPRGTVKWDDIILDDHLQHMNRDDVKEYVRQHRKPVANESNGGDDLVKKERKPRRSNVNLIPNSIIKQESGGFKTKTTAILLGYWSKSLEEDPHDKNAVYGYVDSSGRFNLQVRKQTRDGRELTEVNPDFPGNGRVQKDALVVEEHLQALTHPEVQHYTRIAIAQGLPELFGEELREAERRIAAEILSNRGSEVVGEEPTAPEEGTVARVKRKYTRRSAVQVEPDNGVADEASNMRPPSRPNSRMSVPSFHPAAHMGDVPAPVANNVQGHGFQAQQLPFHMNHGFQQLVPRNVYYTRDGNAVISDGVEFLKSPPDEPPTVDESGTITSKGVQFVQKATGIFKGKFVGDKKEIVSVNGDDYVEYRVLVPME